MGGDLHTLAFNQLNADILEKETLALEFRVVLTVFIETHLPLQRDDSSSGLPVIFAWF